MDARLKISIAMLCGLALAAPAEARGGGGGGFHRGGGGGLARGEHRRGAEGRSDAQIGRRAERTTTNRGERIEARHPNAPHVDERMTRREDGKTQHRDAVRGAEGRDRRQERRPEVKAAADTDASGTLSPEERSAYKERVQTTHQEVKSSRHDLAVEHTKEYQALKAKYDANGDGN